MWVGHGSVFGRHLSRAARTILLPSDTLRLYYLPTVLLCLISLRRITAFSHVSHWFTVSCIALLLFYFVTLLCSERGQYLPDSLSPDLVITLSCFFKLLFLVAILFCLVPFQNCLYMKSKKKVLYCFYVTYGSL